MMNLFEIDEDYRTIQEFALWYLNEDYQYQTRFVVDSMFTYTTCTSLSMWIKTKFSDEYKCDSILCMYKHILEHIFGDSWDPFYVLCGYSSKRIKFLKNVVVCDMSGSFLVRNVQKFTLLWNFCKMKRDFTKANVDLKSCLSDANLVDTWVDLQGINDVNLKSFLKYQLINKLKLEMIYA